MIGGCNMSKDITKDILLSAGFIERDGIFEFTTKVDYRKRTIVVALNNSAMYNRDHTVIVYNSNKEPIGYACVQTVEHFHKLMELMNSGIRLTEE